MPATNPNLILTQLEQEIDSTFNTIAATEMSVLEAKGLLLNTLINGGYIVDTTPHQRTFNYSDALDANAPACATSFNRAFDHEDWIDGESVVQAEQTTGEKGFNWRFHQIENDIDALGAEVARAFACLADLRDQLSLLLGEVRTELNRINADVFNCCQGKSSGVIIDPVLPGAWQWLGNTRIQNKDYIVYEVAGRYQMVPLVSQELAGIGDIIGGNPIVFQPSIGTIEEGQRLKRPGEMARWFATDPDVRALIDEREGRLTKRVLVQNFGDREISPGLTVADAVDMLPANKTYDNPQALLDDLAAREAKQIREVGGADRVSTVLGVTGATIAEAPVERLDVVDTSMRSALARAGFRTVGSISNATPAELNTALRNVGFNAAEGDIQAITATAHSVMRLGG